LLDIKSVPGSTIIITQSGHQALFVGNNSTKIRIKPGRYEVLAIYQQKQTGKVAMVISQQTTNINLYKLSDVTLPSINSVRFLNGGGFTSYGMPATQLNALELALFKFDPYVKGVVFSNINFVPFNPNSSSTLSNVTFNVNMDGKVYSGNLSYSNLSSYISLVLYSVPTDNQVFRYSS
jgi:hypothetical protein